MKDEFIVINKTVIQKRIERLKQSREVEPDNSQQSYLNGKIKVAEEILSQSTPLIPELQKTWNTAYIDAMSIDEETYKPLFFEDYISNLKLNI